MCNEDLAQYTYVQDFTTSLLNQLYVMVVMFTRMRKAFACVSFEQYFNYIRHDNMFNMSDDDRVVYQHFKHMALF